MGFFGKIGHILASPASQFTQHGAVALTTAALGVYNPGLGALVELVANAVFSVEAKSAGAPGAAKKDEVKQIVDISAPVTLAVLASVSGKPVTDPAALAPAIDRLIDDLVALFHALGVFPKNSTQASNAPAIAPV